MKKQRYLISGITLIVALACFACDDTARQPAVGMPESRVIDRADYGERLEGFWLATCIANWTGLVTEMDKIGNLGEIKTGAFYTRADWGQADQPSIWGEGLPSDLSPTIDFVLVGPDSIWGADDDTDIEYIYQELLYASDTTMLSGEDIRNGWLRHIRPEEENYLWVANQRAFDLMKQGMLPPATGDPKNNPDYDMIDAQLTTEIFGLYAPGYPEVALRMAKLAIQTTAREESEWIARFYVSMFAQAAGLESGQLHPVVIQEMAQLAANQLPPTTYPAKMYAYVLGLYQSGVSWEQARDSVYQRYQVEQKDGYDLTSRGLYCNGCFAAGINFAASLISLFYGGGDLKETIKIGTLCGWDSDNPTATWAGMLGFSIGKAGVEEAFGRQFSNQYHIHRTRQNFPNDGIDDFPTMAKKGLSIIDRVVVQELNGRVDHTKGLWHLPLDTLR